MTKADVEDLVIRVRNQYVAQFRAFVQRQRDECKVGGPEVRFKLGADTPAFRRLAIIDFVKNDPLAEGVLFEPENVLSFETIEGSIGTTELTIESLQSDGVVVRHDAPSVEDAIEAWFVKWFDPDDLRYDPEAKFSNCIDAAYIEAEELQIDFGTAPPEAFWEMLHSLADGDATFVKICA